MRFLSIVLGLLLLPALALAVVSAPLWIPLTLVLAALVPGFSVFCRTSSQRTWNLAAYHSPHSLTWRWLVSLSLGRVFSKPGIHLDRKSRNFWPSPFVGFGFNVGFAGAHAYTNNYGWQFGAWVLGVHIGFTQQAPMWYRDLYRQARDASDGLRGAVYVAHRQTEMAGAHLK